MCNIVYISILDSHKFDLASIAISFIISTTNEVIVTPSAIANGVVKTGIIIPAGSNPC